MSHTAIAGRHGCTPPRGDYDGQSWQCTCGYSWTYVADRAVWAGECQLSVNYLDPDDRVGKLHIDRADPVIWISNELMDSMLLGQHHPDVEVKGDFITIRPTNRTVIYRIEEYDPQRRAYLLTWPD